MEETHHIELGGSPDPNLISETSKEIASAEELLALLNDRCDEVTDTEIDLSCSESYDKFAVIESISLLSKNEIIDEDFLVTHGITKDIDQEALGKIPEQDLKQVFGSIVAGYRQSMFNLVDGIVAKTSNIESNLLPKAFVPRNNSHEVVEDIISGELNPVLNKGDFTRAEMEVELDDVKYEVHQRWSSVFEGKKDKMLAKQYLSGKIQKSEFMEKLKQLPEVKFKF